MPHATIKITKVRKAVAKFEFTPATPTLAKMAVSAASKAYIHHMLSKLAINFEGYLKVIAFTQK